MNWQDKHTKRAFREGYAARSVYKLKELNKKYHILGKQLEVLDLGCHPGSWLKYAAENCKKVLGVDLKEIDIKMPNAKTIVKDATQLDEKDISYLEKVDVIISDMAPNTSGNHELDCYKSFELCINVLKISDKYLTETGKVVMKYFQGEEEKELLEECRKRFEFVKAQKPVVSRKKSKEMFIVCKKFK